MTVTRASLLQAIRYALKDQGVATNLLQIDIIGGTAYLKGRLEFTSQAPVTAEAVARVESRLLQLDGIDDVQLELERWEKIGGAWTPRKSTRGLDLEGFVQKNIPTVFLLQALLFFQKNPGTMDRAPGIAARLGAGTGPTMKALEELTELGWLKKSGSTIPFYRYAPDDERRELMRRILELHDGSPEGRRRVLQMITRTGAPSA